MAHLKFTSGENVLYYKNSFSEDVTSLNFLTALVYKKGMSKPQCKDKCRDIALERKNNLISKLRPIIPANRMTFWEQIAASETNVETDLD